ncbi:hypothetical protein D9M71_802100 [compost metagenome]
MPPRSRCSSALRQPKISSLRRAIRPMMRWYWATPAWVGASTTPRPSDAEWLFSTRPRSTSACAERLAWPLFRLAARARSLTDKGA